MGLGLTALLVIVLAGDNRRAGRRQLGIQKSEAKKGATTSTVGERVTALADDAIDRSGARSGLARELRRRRRRAAPERVLGGHDYAVATGVAALFLLLGGPVLGIIGFVMTPLVARSVLTMRAQRRRQAFEEQLPDVLQLMTNALRSGYALPQALDAVATQAAEPASSEFQRVNFEDRVAGGRPGRFVAGDVRADGERVVRLGRRRTRSTTARSVVNSPRSSPRWRRPSVIANDSIDRSRR